MYRHDRNDRGMTLVELLVSVFVISTIAVVLATAVTVTFRQQSDTQGRLDVARWEQALALWLPADLASAATVDADEAAPPPCGSADCNFGTNALQLTSEDGSGGTTTVSYRYGPSNDGVTFILTRVVCSGGSCESQVVLRDLAAPLDPAWTAGDPIPSSIIDVASPLAADSSDTEDPSSSAHRVVVTVNGAAGPDGISRSSRVSFTAGGADIGTIDIPKFSGPTFLNARSGCGGPVTLIADNSGSIGGRISNVRTGIRSFVKAFEGTPTQLQIIMFNSVSSTLGAAPGQWNRFFDLAEPADVQTLIGADGNSGLVSGIVSGGRTNWEDAFYRAWYTANGQTYQQLGNPSIPTPELVVFFTDGVPTYDRQTVKSDSASTALTIDYPYDHLTARADNSGYGGVYTPRGWFRADQVAEQVRVRQDTRLIGVGVGDDFTNTTKVQHPGWPVNGASGTAKAIPHNVFLGDLIAGGDPSRYGDGSGSSGQFVTRTYNATDGWGDVSSADLLVTSDWNQFGGALVEIALVDCGGTLTVQTRDQAGRPADAEVTYEVGAEVVTTSRIVKAATFDIPLSGIPSAVVQLIPQSLDGTGYTAQSWNCRAGGQNLVAGTDFSLIDSLDPAAGINVTVAANAAVSCTMRVAP